MRYLLVYESGEVPDDELDTNVDALYAWLEELSSAGVIKEGIVISDGKTVTSAGVNDYNGHIFGVSIIEADSLDDAVKVTGGWPELKYGGRLHVLEQLTN